LKTLVGLSASPRQQVHALLPDMSLTHVMCKEVWLCVAASSNLRAQPLEGDAKVRLGVLSV
jgi:hypothetical protein